MTRPGHATDKNGRRRLTAFAFCLLATVPFFACEAAEAEGFLLAQNTQGGYLKESPYLARRSGEKSAKPTRHPADPFKPDYHATRKNPSPPKKVKPVKPAGPTHKAAKVNPVEAKVLKLLSSQDPIPRPEQWQKPAPVKAMAPKAAPSVPVAPASKPAPDPVVKEPIPEPAKMAPSLERKLKGILESGAPRPVRRYAKMDPVPVPELAPAFLAMPKPPKPLPQKEPEATKPEEKPAETPVAEEKPKPKSKALAKIAAAMQALRAQQAQEAPKREEAKVAKKEEASAQVLRLPPQKEEAPRAAEIPAVKELIGPERPRFLSSADTALLASATDETKAREKKNQGPMTLLQDAALVSPEMQAQPKKKPEIIARPLPIVIAEAVAAKELNPERPAVKPDPIPNTPPSGMTRGSQAAGSGCSGQARATRDCKVSERHPQTRGTPPQVLKKIVQAAEKQVPAKDESLSEGDLAWVSRVETQDKKKPVSLIQPAPEAKEAPKPEPQKITLGKPIIRRVVATPIAPVALGAGEAAPEKVTLGKPIIRKVMEEEAIPPAPKKTKPEKHTVAATPEPTIRRIQTPVAGSEEPSRIPPPMPLPVMEVDPQPELAQGTSLSPETRAALARLPAGIGTPETPKPRKPLAIKRSGTPDMAVKENKVALHDAQGVKIRVERPNLNLNTAMEEGYDALMAGDLGTAMDRYQAVLERDPKISEAKFGLATTYHRMGELVMARDLYSEILASDPDNLEVLNNLLVLVSQESPRQALAELEKLARRNPDYGPIPAQIAAIHAQLKNFDSAINSIRTAIRIDPQNLAYRYNAAVLLDRAGRKNDAIAMYVELKRAYDRGEDIPADIATIQERLTFLLSNRG